MAATQAANDDFVPILFHPAQQSSRLPRRQPQFLRRVGLLDQLLEADGTEGAFIEARRRTRLLDQAPILTIRQALASPGLFSKPLTQADSTELCPVLNL